METVKLCLFLMILGGSFIRITGVSEPDFFCSDFATNVPFDYKHEKLQKTICEFSNLTLEKGGNYYNWTTEKIVENPESPLTNEMLLLFAVMDVSKTYPGLGLTNCHLFKFGEKVLDVIPKHKVYKSIARIDTFENTFFLVCFDE